MKNILTFTLLLALSTFKSQQIGITSQYLLNDFSINPAVAEQRLIPFICKF